MLTWIFSSRANCLIFCQLIVYPFAFELVMPPLLCSQTNPDNFLIVCCFNPAYVALCLSPGSSSQSAPAKQRPLSGPQPLASQPPPAPLLLSPPVIVDSLSDSFEKEKIWKWLPKSFEIFPPTCNLRQFELFFCGKYCKTRKSFASHLPGENMSLLLALFQPTVQLHHTLQQLQSWYGFDFSRFVCCRRSDFQSKPGSTAAALHWLPPPSSSLQVHSPRTSTHSQSEERMLKREKGNWKRSKLDYLSILSNAWLWFSGQGTAYSTIVAARKWFLFWRIWKNIRRKSPNLQKSSLLSTVLLRKVFIR